MVDRVRVVADISGPSLTKQSMAMESDINNIVARHVAHDLPLFEDGNARYGDFSNVGDYHSALERIRSAEEEFAKLPAAVRDACDNDVGILLDKLQDVKTREDLVKLGLVEAAIPKAPEVPPVVPPVVP